MEGAGGRAAICSLGRTCKYITCACASARCLQHGSTCNAVEGMQPEAVWRKTRQQRGKRCRHRGVHSRVSRLVLSCWWQAGAIGGHSVPQVRNKSTAAPLHALCSAVPVEHACPHTYAHGGQRLSSSELHPTTGTGHTGASSWPAPATLAPATGLRRRPAAKQAPPPPPPPPHTRTTSASCQHGASLGCSPASAVGEEGLAFGGSGERFSEVSAEQRATTENDTVSFLWWSRRDGGSASGPRHGCDVSPACGQWLRVNMALAGDAG